MQVIFLGAEDQTDRELLLGCGVTDIGVNFFDLGATQKKSILSLPDEVHVHLYAGTMPGNVSEDQQRVLMESYESFIAEHSDRLWTWSEVRLSPSMMAERRIEFYNLFDPFRFRPIFHEANSMFDLEALADTYPHVLLTREAVSLLRETEREADPLKTLSVEHATTFHAVGMHRAQKGTYNFASIATAMWQAPRRFGQPVIWDGRKLVRSATHNWDEALEKHYARIKSYGLNTDAIISGDRPEAMRLAVVSLLEYQKACDRTPGLAPSVPPEVPPTEAGVLVAGQVSDSSGGTNPGSSAELVPTGPDNSGVTTRNSGISTSREQTVFPVVSRETMTSLVAGPDGPKMEEITLLSSPSKSVRHCDICVLSRQCPAFAPGEACKFGLPVELKTRDQIMALLQTGLEIQAARVLFTRYQEELSGGALDETLSKEIERMFRLAGQLKSMDEVKETLSVTVERKSSAGVLSSIFGRQAADVLLPAEPPAEAPPLPEVSDN